MCAMFEGPAVVIVWLLAPAIVVIGSVGAGLAFHVISKLWRVKWHRLFGIRFSLLR
jgi:hypothetical protein